MKETHTMGYNVNITSADFHIAEDKLPGLFEALKDLNKRNELKGGGSWSGGKQTGWHFSWLDDDYDKTAKDAKDILEMLGFDVDDDEGLRITGYDSKAGDEGHFLRAAAPFVTPGSSLEWEGEDGERWRQEFDGTTIITKHGRIIYE